MVVALFSVAASKTFCHAMKLPPLLSRVFSLRSALRGFFALALTSLATQCASPVSSGSSSDGALGGSARTASLTEKSRPGLGTGFGESRWSEVDSTTFRRGSSHPAVSEKIFYNDRQGVLAATGGGGRKFSGWKKIGSGSVSFGLKSEGGWLRGVEDGNTYVIGEPGERYDILLRNETSRRVEVVVSVDGLDVLDGRPASVQKRGYVIPGHGSVRIEGWRTSMNQVAAFRFASVSRSYAAMKHGDTRNVGVIGVAVFLGEDAVPHFSDPVPGPWRTGDTQRREKANPFPASGRWASPP